MTKGWQLDREESSQRPYMCVCVEVAACGAGSAISTVGRPYTIHHPHLHMHKYAYVCLVVFGQCDAC